MGGHAFAVMARGGKGYTWLAESAEERDEWFEAISKAIEDTLARRKTKAGAGRTGESAANSRERLELAQQLAMVLPKPLNQRLDVVTEGTLLTKYNLRDGKASYRWVKLVLGENKLCWGDPKTRECKSEVRLSDSATESFCASSEESAATILSKMPCAACLCVWLSSGSHQRRLPGVTSSSSSASASKPLPKAAIRGASARVC